MRALLPPFLSPMVLAVLLALHSGTGHAQALEARVKAAFLLNFARFISLPANRFSAPDAPFDVCVLTPDPLLQTLDDSLVGKVVRGHPVRLRRSDRPELLRDCHLVYLSPRSDELLQSQLSKLSGFGLITVHESEQALAPGVVRLFAERNRQRFEVNLAAVEREQLIASAGLLEIAQRVRQ